jgi:hypothetical protein
VRDLSAGELLDVWERGADASPIERALALLAAAHGLSPGEIARWPIGTRDGHLLRFRERTFGPSLEALAECPSCGETAETGVDIADLLALAATAATDRRPLVQDAAATTTLTEPVDVPPPETEPIGVEWAMGDGRSVRFRPVTSDDLLAVLRADAGATALLERCIVSADVEPAAVLRAFEGGVIPSLGRVLADADPLADIALDLRCPSCGQAWAAPFDIVSYVWTEIDAWAMRTLRDVHRLARAYGWSESAILALSPARRAAYLEMVDG